MIAAALLLALLGAPEAQTAPAPSPVAATTAPATAQPAKGGPDEIICHREADTGSMLAKRTCRRRADWEGIAQNSAASLDRYRSDVRAGAPR